MYWTILVEIGKGWFSGRLQSGGPSSVDFSRQPMMYEEFIPSVEECDVYKMLYPKSLPWLEMTSEELYIEYCLKQGLRFNLKKL